MGTSTDDDVAVQKEWLSRAFLVATAASAGFSVEVRLNDINGVDATVHDGGIVTDWQLKGTAAPQWSADQQTLYYDLDIRTYSLFIGERNASAFLAVVVMPKVRLEWVHQEREHLLIRHVGYWQRITGMSPNQNEATVRIHLPIHQTLRPEQLTQIMAGERARIAG